jgi:hypothetical protein
MRGSIPPFPQYVFIAWYLVKHKDSLTFYQSFWYIQDYIFDISGSGRNQTHELNTKPLC